MCFIHAGYLQWQAQIPIPYAAHSRNVCSSSRGSHRTRCYQNQASDLVLVDTIVRSRDNPSDVYLCALVDGFTEGSKKLMREVYRDWTYAEFCNAPLESLSGLNEKHLLGDPGRGGLGYKFEDLAGIAGLLVPYGGFEDVGLQAGETVIVAPATGPFGGAAVRVALAMGARVIAMGRNTTSLANVKAMSANPDLVLTVPITGNMEADCAALKRFGPVDAYFDICPPEASKSTHIKSCFLALRHGARISLMGGYRDDVAIPHSVVMHGNLRIFGKWMYERSDIADFLKIVDNGLLKLGEAGGSTIVGQYPLEQWKEAWDAAAENAGAGKHVIIKP